MLHISSVVVFEYRIGNAVIDQKLLNPAQGHVYEEVVDLSGKSVIKVTNFARTGPIPSALSKCSYSAVCFHPRKTPDKPVTGYWEIANITIN